MSLNCIKTNVVFMPEKVKNSGVYKRLKSFYPFPEEK